MSLGIKEDANKVTDGLNPRLPFLKNAIFLLLIFTYAYIIAILVVILLVVLGPLDDTFYQDVLIFAFLPLAALLIVQFFFRSKLKEMRRDNRPRARFRVVKGR